MVSLLGSLHHHHLSSPLKFPKSKQLSAPSSLSNINIKFISHSPFYSSSAAAAASTLSSSSSSAAAASTLSSSSSSSAAAVVKNKRTRYRKAYPGEAKGIVEEMRFVAMKLRNNSSRGSDSDEESADGETWRPSMEGFVKYLVDSRLVFETLERIIEDSTDVAYTYFRKTGLERSANISKDLEWFGEQGSEIPDPSSPGITYATYLEELAENSAPSFLCHFYNIYFAHISGGQAIGKQVCEKLLQGKELEFYKWQGNVHVLLNDVREKLNKLGEHWSRDEKNRCLREASKSFRFSGQIVRLIIL